MIYGGIDIGGTSIKFGFVNEYGELVCQSRIPVHDFTDYDSFLQSIVESVLRLHQESGLPDRVAGYGVGSPGNIDASTGQVVWIDGKLEFLHQQQLASDLEQRFAKPVVADNDVNTILLGEWRFGAAAGYNSVVGIALGTGIGGAIIYNGQLLHGAHHASANFGYMSARPNGTPHVCGNQGAAENYASHAGIIEQLEAQLQNGRTSSLRDVFTQAGPEFGFRHIYDAASVGDPLAVELIDDMVEQTGVLIANLIYALDPEVTLLGGGIMHAGDTFIDRIVQCAKARIATFPAEKIRILPMALGDSAGIFGGAAMIMQKIR